MLIKGEKVRLRPVSMDDVPNRFSWFNNSEIIRPYLGRLTFTTRKQVEEAITDAAKLDPLLGYIELSIDKTPNLRYIGNIFLRNINLFNRSAEFGIVIGIPDLLGVGLGFDAALLMLGYGFDELQLHRIWLTVFSFNERAEKCFTKCGFKREGLLRETIFAGGKFHDTIFMSILENEWRALSTNQIR